MPDRLRLGDLVARGSLLVNDGYRTRVDELGRPGIPVLRVAEVQQGHLAPTLGDHVLERYRPKIADKVSRPGDIVVTTKGTVGRVARIPVDSREFVYSPQVCFFRCLDETVDSRWLYYWFRGPGFISQAAAVQSQTDMAAYINLADMRAMKLTLPGITEQRFLSTTLGVLDDKIESNRRIAASTRGLARALYIQACNRAATDVAVADFVTFKNSRRVPLSARERESFRGPVPYYGATGVVGHVKTALFDEPLLLVGEDGSVVHQDGYPVIQYVWGPSWVNNHAHVLTGRGVSTEVALLALERADVRPLITGAVQAKLSMGNLKRLRVTLPDGRSLEGLEKAMDPLFAVIRQRSDESRCLTLLRDALLPELLSGRIRAPEADEAVQSALA